MQLAPISQSYSVIDTFLSAKGFRSPGTSYQVLSLMASQRDQILFKLRKT